MFKSFTDFVKQQSKMFKRTGLSPNYIWDARNEEKRFWMIDTQFPKLNGKTLLQHIKNASESNKFTVQVGTGYKQHALRDLASLNIKNIIGLDMHMNTNDYQGVTYVPVNLTQPLQIEDKVFSGVIFGSYLFSVLPADIQLHLLNEIDRISGKSSVGFLGPLYPQTFKRSIFSESFSEYKNQLFGFVNERKQRPGEEWHLYRSRATTLSPYIASRRALTQQRHIPLLSYLSHITSSAINKGLGFVEVKKDYEVYVPNHYFIVFKK